MNAVCFLEKLRCVDGSFTVKAALPTGTVADVGMEIYVFNVFDKEIDDEFGTSLTLYMQQPYESHPVTVAELIEIITNEEDASSMEEVEFRYNYIVDILPKPDSGSYPICGITAVDNICYIRCRYNKGCSMDDRYPEES